MYKPSILILCAVLAPVCGAKSDQLPGKRFNLGVRTITVPIQAPLKEYNPASADEAALLDQFQFLDGRRLITVASSEDIDAMHHGTHPTLHNVATVMADKSVGSEYFPSPMFDRFAAAFQMQMATEQSGDSTAPLPDAIRAAANEILDGDAPAVPEHGAKGRLLGCFGKGPDRVSVLALRPIHWKHDGAESDQWALAAYTLVNVNHRIMTVATFRTFASAQDAVAIQDFTTRFVRDLFAANPEPRATWRPGDRTHVTLGGRAVDIPYPVGHVNLDNVVPEAKSLVNALVDPDFTRLLTVFSENDVRRIGIANASDSIGIVLSLDPSVQDDISSFDFSAMELAIRIQSGVVGQADIDKSRQMAPAIAKKLRRLLKRTVAIKLGDCKVLNCFNSGKDHISLLMDAKLTLEVGGEKTNVSYFTAMTWLRVNRRLVLLVTCHLKAGPTDKRALTDATTNWTGQILAANRGRE